MIQNAINEYDDYTYADYGSHGCGHLFGLRFSCNLIDVILEKEKK